MKFIHMSDLHITSKASELWGIKTNEVFVSALKKINYIDKIDAIFVSGDIADDGKVQSYRFADKLFSKLGITTYWCPGNHDNIKVLSSFSNSSFCKFYDHAYVDGYKFIILSTIAVDSDNPNYNRASGKLKEDTLQKVDKELYEDPIKTIIITHHPALETGGWLDCKILKNRKEFRAILERHSNVKLVLSGHVHTFTDLIYNGIRYSTATSLSFAFDKLSSTFKIAPHQNGFSIITIEGDEINIKNVTI